MSQSLNRCIELVERTVAETRWAEDAAKAAELPPHLLAKVQRLRKEANETAHELNTFKEQAKR
jgi:hypothetical protein